MTTGAGGATIPIEPRQIQTQMLLYPVVGWEWVAVGFAFVADLGAYTGGFRSRRKVTG